MGQFYFGELPRKWVNIQLALTELDNDFSGVADSPIIDCEFSNSNEAVPCESTGKGFKASGKKGICVDLAKHHVDVTIRRYEKLTENQPA